MAFVTTHAALGGGIAAIALAVAGADPNMVTISLVLYAGIRTAWPDLSMVVPTIRKMLKARKDGDPDWKEARDWKEYVIFHHPIDLKIEDPLYKFHRLIDTAFHEHAGENWWARLWWLDLGLLAMGLIGIWAAFDLMSKAVIIIQP